MDGQVSGLGTVHPLLTLSFVSTWILPLYVVFSTLKRKSSSSVMDGLQRRIMKGHHISNIYESVTFFFLLQRISLNEANPNIQYVFLKYEHNSLVPFFNNDH